MTNNDTKRKEQIEFRAGSARDGLIANYVPIEQAFMYEDGFKMALIGQMKIQRKGW